MAKEKERLLIFDFDGTIVNSKEVYFHAIEKHLSNIGFSKNITDKFIDMGMSLSETLKNLGVSRVSRWFVKRKIMKDVLKRVNEIKKCRDAEHIKGLSGKKILLSNSQTEFIIPVLKHLKLEDEFDEIYGIEAFDNKTDFIKEYLKRNDIDKKNCFYIGDRVVDIRLARDVGCKSIIISNKCSWSPRKQILEEKPDFIVFDLDNLKNALQ